MCLQELALYLDYRLDESYTPKHISVRAGNSFIDMTEIHTQELDEPHGWIRIPLLTQNIFQGMIIGHVHMSVSIRMTSSTEHQAGLLLMLNAGLKSKLMHQLCAGDYLKAFCIQLAVLSNHQNGRDTHIRQINVFGPRRDPLRAIGYPLEFEDCGFLSYATIR